MKSTIGCITGAVLVLGCVSAAPAAERHPPASTIEAGVFGRMPDGTEVRIYTLKNQRGAIAKVTEYGATLTELWMPDRDGKLANVVLGFDRLEPYLNAPFFFGAVMGRVANRIGNGKFTLDGHDYVLATNRPPNHSHGGMKGFDKRVWSSRPLPAKDKERAVEFTYISPDGE